MEDFFFIFIFRVGKLNKNRTNYNIIIVVMFIGCYKKKWRQLNDDDNFTHIEYSAGMPINLLY